MNIKKYLSEKIQSALIESNINNINIVRVRYSKIKEHGDYNTNVLVGKLQDNEFFIKNLHKNLMCHINFNEIIAYKIQILHAGFINIFLHNTWIIQNLIKVKYSERIGVNRIRDIKKIVIDYSSPNIAKEMHVGHLRSTIIGDVITRVLLFLGYEVIKANHVGDWGLQFGMLLAYLEKIVNINKKTMFNISLSEIDVCYSLAKEYYDNDPEFAECAKNYLVKLQKFDQDSINLWKKLVTVSIDYNQTIYKLLNVMLTYSDIQGESFYSNMLSDIVSDLQYKGLAIKKNGAIIVILDKFQNKLGNEMGVVIQKKDGAYLYITIEIACIKYRCNVLQADRIIYYIDSRQNQHLELAWEISKKAGYVSKKVLLEHHTFGMILNNEGIPFKTRSGNVIKLVDLLNEAISRAYFIIKKKNPFMKKDDIEKLSKIIGIGALKYSDLSKHRKTNYIFDWDKILNFEGNTSLYIQYTYTRALSILNKMSFLNNLQMDINLVVLKSDIEKKLAIFLLRFEEILTDVGLYGTPHLLCNYLYEMSVLFSLFYETCSVMKVNSSILQYSRFQLVLLTEKIIKKGLNLLGIEIVEYM